MQMRTRRTPGRAHVSDNRSGSYALPLPDSESRHVHINRFKSLAVVNGHRSPAEPEHPHDPHCSAGRGMNRPALSSALIDTAVIIAGGFTVMQTGGPERRIDAAGYRRLK